MTKTKYIVKLFVVEKNQNAQVLDQRLIEILDTLIAGQYTFEKIDILKFPERAIQEKILASPTLVIEYAGNKRRLLGGDIDDMDSLLEALNISR